MGTIAALLALTSPVHAQVNVLTNRYDGARTGANLSETTLTVANVNPSQFGKLYSYPVDGSVYAQPLYMSGVAINGTPRNVLYVATMNDKVYAFDADSTSPSPLWMRDFTNPPSVTPVPIADIVAPNLNIVGNVGIQSTPVIDAASRTIYLVARTKENGSYFQRLHALDIATGASRPGSPVTITGSVVGSAPDSIGQVVTFNPKMQSQRAGLAISNGVVLISWAGHEDAVPYHGWVMGYDTTSLARVGIYCITPDVYAGGIWQGGRAPAIDAAGNAYFATGNGRWDGNRSFGNSLLKFSVSRTGGVSLLDYFTPGNHAQLDADDDDLSGSGFTLLPGTNLLLGGGKEGVLYLLDADNLGRMVPNDTQIVQRIPVTGGHVMGGAVYWNSANLGPMVYNWSEDDALKSYRLSGGRLALPAHAQGLAISPGHPGGSLTLSANGNASHTGIVWSSMPAVTDAIHGLHPGVLRAFNAETLAEIWSSERNPSRDRAGTLMKFVPPVVVNGKVFLPNHDNAVVVYGLLPQAPPPPAGSAGTISVSFAGNHPTAMAPGETAGVVAAANWNNAFGSSGSMSLRNASGASTSVSVTWSGAGGTWMLPIADQPGNARMMKGYLDTGSFSTTRVSVTGLAQAAYDVYVYADGDNKIYERSAAYTISGPGITTTTVNLTDAADANFGGTFTRASNSTGNYVRFSIAATGFTIDATPTTPEGGTRRAPVNAIQIVPTSEPPPPPPPPDFSLDAHPHSRSVTQGATTTYEVTATAWNGFSGTIALSVSGAPAGTTTTFNPASINGSGSSTLTVTTSTSTPTGTSALTVTGRSGTLSHSESVALTVEAAPPPPPPPSGSGTISIDFAGNNPASMGATETAGVVAKANWNSAFGATSSAPLSLKDETGAPTNARLSWSAPGGTYMTPIADQPGSARMMKGYLDTTSTSTTTVWVTGLAAGTYDIYVYADGDNKGYERAAAYTISGSGIATTTINLTDAANANFDSTFARADNSNGNYVRFSISLSAAGGFTLEAVPTTPEVGTRRAPVNGIQIVPTSEPPPPPPDFSLQAQPHSRTVAQGATTTYDVTATASNGFSGTITLSVSGAPAGTTTTFNPASINGSGGSTLTVATSSSTPAGTSTLTITGTSGTLSHSESVALVVEAAAPPPPPPPSGSGTISIDFVGNNPASMEASETAGVVPKANWNSAFQFASSAPLPLKDETGAATNATVAWYAPGGTYMTPIADQPGSARMMKGYLDTTSTSTTTVWVTGLAAGTYDIYVYADGDNKGYERAAAYTISGSGITTTTINLTDAANANFDSTFTRAENSNGNYVRFSISLGGGGGFTLEAVPTTPEVGTRRAPVNGIQIVPTSAPPPPPPPAMGAIGIDFVGSSGIAMAATETAGVIAQANWNSAAGGTQSSPLALVDASGAATSATVTWSANGGWATPTADQPGDRRMMRGYLDTNSTSVTTVTVAGLPSASYDVYVYADGDNREYTRTAAYRISGSGSGVTDTTINLTDTANTNFSGTFTQAAGTAGNYVKFTIAAGGFTLTATPVSGTNPTLRAPINGIQIVPR